MAASRVTHEHQDLLRSSPGKQVSGAEGPLLYVSWFFFAEQVPCGEGPALALGLGRRHAAAAAPAPSAAQRRRLREQQEGGEPHFLMRASAAAA